MSEFVSIGFDSYVNVDKVRLIYSATQEKVRKELKRLQMDKSSSLYWDATSGKEVHAVLVLDDGMLVISAINAETLNKRIYETNGGNLK